MLTAELVRARRRGKQLQLLRLDRELHRRAVALAKQYLQIARGCVGQQRGVFEAACGAVRAEGREHRLAAGLLKLVTDRCVFEVEAGIDPGDLRRDLFARATRYRQDLAAHQRFDRETVIAAVARDRGLTAEQLEGQLYADLRAARKMLSFEPVGAERLVAVYQLAQAQAVLLRALRVTAEVRCSSPGTFRHLFRKLRFLRLLFTVECRGEGHYRIVIDGPYSLFRSVTKYGLQLALVLPALRECDRWHVQAEVLWGKSRTPLLFEQEGGVDEVVPANQGTSSGGRAMLADEVSALLRRFEARDTPWRASPCVDVLSLAGVGVSVPDLVFEHAQSGVRVYLEVLGYWSREAVWKRVDLVEKGLGQRIIFAVSSRLRVSEAVLDADLPGTLYVYKGVMHAGAIEEKLGRFNGGVC